MFICRSIFCGCSCAISDLGEARGDLGPDDNDMVGDWGTLLGSGRIPRFVLPEGLAAVFEV